MMSKMPIPTAPASEPRQTVREKIYNTMLEWIVNGTLQPGEKILDTEIAQYFSASRTPVREAIQLLADQRLIEITPGRASRALGQPFYKGMGPGGFCRSNYLLMGKLNALAAELAGSRLDKAFLSGLRLRLAEMNSAVEQGDYKGIITADYAFHYAFFEEAGNPFLKDFFRNLYAHCLRIETLYFSRGNDFSESVRQHTMILDALSAGDLPAAQVVLTENWTHTIPGL